MHRDCYLRGCTCGYCADLRRACTCVVGAVSASSQVLRPLAVAGLGLSTASGLNTWLVHKVPGAWHVTIGTERIRPWLLAAWAATYTLSLWDAWTGASRPEAEEGSSNR